MDRGIALENVVGKFKFRVFLVIRAKELLGGFDAFNSFGLTHNFDFCHFACQCSCQMLSIAGKVYIFSCKRLKAMEPTNFRPRRNFRSRSTSALFPPHFPPHPEISGLSLTAHHSTREAFALLHNSVRCGEAQLVAKNSVGPDRLFSDWARLHSIGWKTNRDHARGLDD